MVPSKPKLVLTLAVLTAIPVTSTSTKKGRTINLLQSTTENIETVQPTDTNTSLGDISQKQLVPKIARHSRVPKSRKPVSLLKDAYATVKDVQPEHISIIKPDSSKESQNNKTKSKTCEKFEEFLKQGKHEQIIQVIEKTENGKFLEHLYPALTKIEHYQGLFEYFGNSKTMPKFFACGNIELVRKIIIEFDKMGSKYQYSSLDLRAAIISAFDEDKCHRFIDLLDAQYMVTVGEGDISKKKKELGYFKSHLWLVCNGIVLKGNVLSFRKFFAHYGNEFNERYPIIYEAFCECLVGCLEYKLSDSNMAKLLTDLVAQPYLLSQNAFMEQFLSETSGFVPSSCFIEYGWREVIEEGLKGKHRLGGENLWYTIAKKFPELPTRYADATDSLDIILKRFSTKRELEERWNETNSVTLRKRLENLNLYILPTVLLVIVAKYAISLTDV